MPVKVQLRSAAASDMGRKRTNNEDRYLHDPERGIFAVVDGLGGHAAGEHAAETAVEVLRERLGRQTGYERTAHLLLELGDRLAAAGLGDGRRFPMPLTQESLADALGLSVVHVNRILQQLRRERLIELRSGEAVLIERDLLVGVADYRSCLTGAAA